MKTILLEGKFGTFGNLAHTGVFELAGHACVSLIGPVKHIMTHIIPIRFAEETNKEGDTRDQSNTNRYPAMD